MNNISTEALNPSEQHPSDRRPTMKHIPTLTLVCLLAAAGPTLAQAQSANSPARNRAAPASAVATEMTEGEVRKVDKAAGKITLKHGEIKNIGMPPMTMVFQAKDPALLDKVKAGDKVRFTAADIKGVLTLMSIEKSR
jgi:Cu(I)/Ag(I) efflux system protein CusF